MSCLLGHHNALAARGALLYMVNHSLFKLVLFMAAGVVYMNLHKLDLNDVRGFGRGKPLLHFAFLMGAFGLMGVPAFSGYVSKTLIHESIVEYVHLLQHDGLNGLALLYTAAEWIYLISGGLTGAYMIKLYICLFWQKHPTEQPFHNARRGCYMNKLSALALTASALLVPVLGVQPNLTMDKIADFAGGFLHAGVPEHAVHYFAWVNLKGACISLGIGLAVYLLVIRTLLMRKEMGVRVYVNLWPEWFDIEDGVYRPALRCLSFTGAVVAKAFGDVMDTIALLFTKTVLAMGRYTDKIRVGNFVTDTMGGFADWLAELLNRTVMRSQPKEHHFTGTMAGLWDGVLHAVRRVTHTMSYGLLLFGLGLCVMIIYLLMY